MTRLRTTASILPSFTVMLACSSLAVGFMPRVAAAETVFSTSFDYAGGNPAVGTDSANANGADGQIGLFSGGLNAGDIIVSTSLGSSNGDTFLRADRSGVSTGFAFSANFSSAVQVVGTTVEFDYATRRTNGSTNLHAKDNSIIGFGSDGQELFHIVISANSADDPGDPVGDVARVGFLGGGSVVWDLPTTVGADADGDLVGFGKADANSDPNAVGSFSLVLGATGYTLDFSNGANSYTTDVLAYNGAASDLARIEFRGQGGVDNGFRSGFYLDDIVVNGTAVPEPTSLLCISAIGLGLLHRRRRA